MTELAEIAMFIRLNWQLLAAIILMIVLAIWLIPPAVKKESESMSKILQEDYDTVHANIKLAMEGAKKQSYKKYGDQNDNN